MRRTWPGDAGAGEGAVVSLDPQVGPLAAKLEVVVAHEDAGEEAGLAKHLEAVADAQHETAVGGEAGYGGHDGGEASDCPGAEVVAVGEAAGEDYAVYVGEGVVLVPEVARLLAQDCAEGVVAIAVAPGAGEDHYAEAFFVSLGIGCSQAITAWLLAYHYVILNGVGGHKGGPYGEWLGVGTLSVGWRDSSRDSG